MFALRGLDGELFRGSLEHLLKTHRVLPAHRNRGVQQGYEEAAAAPDATGAHDDKHYHAAAAAYAAVQKPAAERGPVYYAYQVMSRGVLTLSPDSGVENAWRAIMKRDVGQAPVVDGDQRVVGLVSRAHLLRVLNDEGGKVSDVLARTVADVMGTPVVAVEPVTDVRRIARVMLEYGLPALPVVDGPSNSLVGIVSRGDILRVVVTEPPLTLWA
jgi:CBS domain-containing protein